MSLLDDLEAKAAKATPLPWHACQDSEEPELWTVAPGACGEALSFLVTNGSEGDARYIAAAANAAPTLVAAVRKMRKALVREHDLGCCACSAGCRLKAALAEVDRMLEGKE